MEITVTFERRGVVGK